MHTDRGTTGKGPDLQGHGATLILSLDKMKNWCRDPRMQPDQIQTANRRSVSLSDWPITAQLTSHVSLGGHRPTSRLITGGIETFPGANNWKDVARLFIFFAQWLDWGLDEKVNKFTSEHSREGKWCEVNCTLHQR